MKKVLIIMLVMASCMQLQSQDRFIRRNGQDLFLNGMNLAWMSYANDLGAFNEAAFIKAVTSIRESGGNTIRWWLHVNGQNSPQFTGDKVSGISQTNLANLKRALDIAAENGVVLDLCLWSFGMLDKTYTAAVLDRNTKLLTDTAYTNAYIRNALLPMVRYVKNHPGLLCWEVFNEPEGMSTEYGWSDYQHVNMSYIQKFVNLVAGAIHREDSTLKVSNGTVTLRTATDMDGFTNFYRPDRLIKAGGDSLGTLDFYMVHYYTANGTQYSPFRKPASYWKLDKPLVIGEFSAKGITEAGAPAQTPEELYNWAYDQGYAGALSWTYTNHDGNGGLPDCGAAMLKIAFNHSDHVILKDAKPFNFNPYQKKPLYIGWKYKGTKDTIRISPLLAYITDKEDSSLLTFTVKSTTNPVAANIKSNDTLELISSEATEAGVYTTLITATDTGNKSITLPVFMSVIDTTSDDVLLNRPLYVSSIESTQYYGHFANDNSDTTRFSTEYADNQSMLFVLDKEYTLQRMLMKWEAAYGKAYSIELSTDSANWTKVYSCTNENGGYDKIVFSPTKAKYVKVNLEKRGTQWGFSLFTIQAFEDAIANNAPYFLPKISDTTFYTRTRFTLNLSQSAKDSDLGDRIKYRLALLNNANLPTFITFNDSTYVLTGRPTSTDTTVLTFVITATDIEGAEATDTFSVKITQKTAIENIARNNVRLYPNPVSDKLIIENAENIDCILIFSTDGKLLNKYAVKTSVLNGKYELYLGQLNAGNYLVHLQSKSGNTIAPITVIK
ncbi:MAG TPA: discoidin domain-containing protein [Bacteroidales bacterium]|nr:discoidin domain-containing protein [Bacteroidales bacterium]